jgi:cell division septal protein FtsQ
MAVDEIDDIPPEDESATEEESPFRRRPRAVPVRRGKAGRLKRLLRWAIWGLVILPAVGYGSYRLAMFGLTSPRFMLTSPEDVVLTGNQYVSREEVLNALGFPPAGRAAYGINIFKFPLEGRRKQIESISWVRSATLTRVYPNRLAVHVVERTPVAFVNLEGRLGLVDGEGVLLEKPERASFNFPVLTGLEKLSGPPERAARLGLYDVFLKEVAEEAASSGWVISEVDLADGDDLKAVVAEGRETIQLHFGREGFAGRFRNFLTLLPELHKSASRVDAIDLRYGNQIVVSPQVATPRSEEAAAPAAPPPGTREN